MFLRKLFSMKITNLILFLPASERKKITNKDAGVITGLSIIGNNEIRFFIFMFTNNKAKEKKKSNKHAI